MPTIPVLGHNSIWLDSGAPTSREFDRLEREHAVTVATAATGKAVIYRIAEELINNLLRHTASVTK